MTHSKLASVFFVLAVIVLDHGELLGQGPPAGGGDYGSVSITQKVDGVVTDKYQNNDKLELFWTGTMKNPSSSGKYFFLEAKITMSDATTVVSATYVVYVDAGSEKDVSTVGGGKITWTVPDDIEHEKWDDEYNGSVSLCWRETSDPNDPTVAVDSDSCLWTWDP